MITVKVDTSGLLRLRAELEGKAKQVAFAAERALNSAAYKASRDTAKEMARVFDRPTSWVLRSVRYTKADREKQTKLESTVDFDYWGNKQGVTVSQVLKAQIYGGTRRLKRFERALQRINILPQGMVAVPGAAAKMDAHGNMSAGQINQVLSWFSAFGEQGYQANATDKSRAKRRKGTKKTYGTEFVYFAPGARRTWTRGTNIAKGSHKMQPGIYQRIHTGFGSALRPIMIFVRMARYRRLLDFYGIAEKSAIAEFNATFPRMLEEAWRTAR